MQKMENKNKLYGRERVCASIIDTKIKGRTLNIGAGEMQWIENILFVKNKDFFSSDLDKKNLGKENKAINKIQADATKLPFKDGYFSQVIILDVLEHIKDHNKALEEINRVLKKGGRLAICVPNDTLLSYLNPVRYVQHERHYTIQGIVSLLKKKRFKIKNVFAGGRIFELLALYIHFFAKYILRTKKSPFLEIIDKKEYCRHIPNGNEIAILAIKN
ncbi:class I SAM-dependent methyltransferase [Candidatus Pacearchaeota archaeon]|nr:class I SAM-dependent methyltransferase [Candidatus Pacearchaeota archaeon]